MHWCPTGSFEPSGSILNAILTSAISFAIASHHKVFPLASLILWALLTVFSISNPNLCVHLWYRLLTAVSICLLFDRIPSTTPGADPPRDARDSGSARSHSTHLETRSPDQPKMVTYTESQTVSSYMSVKCTRRTLHMPNFTRATHAQPSLSDFPWRDSEFWRADPLTRDDPGGTKFSHFPPK